MINAPRLLLIILLLFAVPPARSSPSSSSPQEQAQFLAGIPMPRRSSLAQLQNSPEYRAHRRELLDRWGFCRQARYGPMQGWAAEHLARYPTTRGVLRYLFGGPDFLNAHAFFPDARVMVLGGLEPVGKVPPPEALSPAELGLALKSLDEALGTSLFAGYFITSEMKPQLAAGAFRGVLPVLYTELAITGNIVDSVDLENPFGSPGVRITYHRPGGPVQTLWYFQADLSNGKECRRFLSWLGELGPGASYLKAASYLLPLDSFSETRDFLTRTSSLILQDDSGLPFRAFLPGIWRLSLFGAYTEPLPIFGLKRDPVLAEAYESPLMAGPLPFGAGYHVNAKDANLLLAVRSDGAEPLPVLPPPGVPSLVTESPSPHPFNVRIRKALPVPIRRAIPIAPPSPDRVSAAIPTATPAGEVHPTPQVAVPASPAPVPGATAVEQSAPASTPVPEPSPTPVPAASALFVPETPVIPPESSSTPIAESTPAPVSESTPASSPLASPVLSTPVPEPSPVAQPEESPMESPSGQG